MRQSLTSFYFCRSFTANLSASAIISEASFEALAIASSILAEINCSAAPERRMRNSANETSRYATTNDVSLLNEHSKISFVASSHMSQNSPVEHHAELHTADIRVSSLKPLNVSEIVQ